MERFVAGDVVIVSFPFSDFKGQKLRPALVLAEAEFSDLILCQITSKPYTSHTAIKLNQADFVRGGLPIVSYIRPDKLFTTDPSIIQRTVGHISDDRLAQVLKEVKQLF